MWMDSNDLESKKIDRIKSVNRTCISLLVPLTLILLIALFMRLVYSTISVKATEEDLNESDLKHVSSSLSIIDYLEEAKIAKNRRIIKDTRDTMDEGDIIIINNPYKDVDWEKTNQYKANLHTHTTESDGEFTVEETITKYYEAGYDILSITDHDNMTTEKPTWPWKDWGKDPDELGMLAVKGNEISNTHHIASYFNDYGDKLESQEENALKEIKARDGLATMCHPGRYDKEVEWYVDLYDNFYNSPLVGMEVFSMLNRYSGDIELWDEINAKMMPEKIVYGHSVDDMHRKYQLFNSYNYILMDDLTEVELRNSLKTGEFFFVHEPYGGGKERVPRVKKIIVDENEIRIKADNYSKIKWIGEGTKKISQGDTINVSELDGVFVRAVLVNKWWGRTYTQPFGIGNKKET